jgi:hypothetical protein
VQPPGQDPCYPTRGVSAPLTFAVATNAVPRPHISGSTKWRWPAGLLTTSSTVVTGDGCACKYARGLRSTGPVSASVTVTRTPNADAYPVDYVPAMDPFAWALITFSIATVTEGPAPQ